MTDRPIYEFDGIRVDVGRMTAVRGDAAIPLEPKAFDVLVFLIERRDRLVTKDELLDAVWRDTFVTPNVLTRAVAQIRKGFGDEAGDARYIETLAKRGYRFIAPVAVIAADGSDRATAAVGPAPVPPPAIVAPEPPIPLDPTLAAGHGRRVVLMTLVAAAIVLPLVAGLFYVENRRTSRTKAIDLHLTRVTNRRGYSGAAAISPQGNAIVYASDTTGALELYMVSLAPGSAEVALTNDRGQNTQPAWSPDGQWIAFHSRRRGGVWIVPASGGVAQQVVEFGSEPAWSPASDTIVFSSDAGGAAGQGSLWTVRRDGTARRQLTQIGKPVGGHHAPNWSHDGKHVVFIVASGGWAVQIWTVDVDTGDRRPVTTSQNASSPCFAPDDRTIYWGGTTEDGNGRLFYHALDASAAPIGDTEVTLPFDAGYVEGVSIANNGVAAFAIRTEDANLWAIDIGADGRAREPTRLTDDVARNTHAAYSHDGRLAHLQIPIGSRPSVWLMNEDGSDRAPLLAGTESVHPEWDRDDSRVLVVRPAGERGEFSWVDIASRRMTPAGLAVGDIRNARLSPDSQRLAFHRIDPDGKMSVWTGGFDGSRTKVASDEEAVSYPVWSRDGTWLALEIKRGDQTHIGIVPSAGGAVTQITSERGQSWAHSWAPDNDRIAFAGQRDGVWNVYAVSRSTRVTSRLTGYTSGSGYVRYPMWSPQGTRIVFERATESASVWTMTLPAIQ